MARWLIPDRLLPLTQEALAQLLGVRRTTVTLAIARLRAAGAIRSDRRGLIEIDRSRLDSLACECYDMMQARIERIYSQELSEARLQIEPVRAHANIDPGQLDKRGT
jgi:DNA-binding FadR family transcriptional regulator